MIHSHQLHAFHKQHKSMFSRLVQLYQPIFIFIECASRKRDSKVAQISFFNRPFQEQYNECGRRGSRSSFHGSRSCKRAQGRRVQFLRLLDEGATISFFNNESGRCLATGVMAEGTDISLDLSLNGVELRSVLLAFVLSVEAEWDRLLEQLNLFEME